MILTSSVVFADGAPSYNKNMYTVVVSNPDGAKVYSDGFVESKIVEYGTKYVVKHSFEQDGKTYLCVGDMWDTGLDACISSEDVEIYGEPVSPSDLRIKRNFLYE